MVYVDNLYDWGIVQKGNGYNLLLLEYRNGSNGIHLYGLPDFRYSAEEIRFNLLAIAQRPLPILTSKLNDLNALLSTLHTHLETITPDWNALAEFVLAAESQVDSSLIAKAIKRGDVRDLLSLKKALDRDIAILKTKLIDEEEKLSEYAVTILSWLAD